MKMKFKVGDKVKFKKDLEVGKYYGGIEYLDLMDKDKDKDTIYTIGEARGVCLTLLINGRWKWFVTPEMIEYAEEDTAPTITQHLIRGNKTIVKLSNGKVGIAQCSPEDKFDVYEGLRVATARAYGREIEEPKKEEPKFAVWDRVRYTGADSEERDFGDGMIVKIDHALKLPYLVMFDKPRCIFHNGGYSELPPRCWWCGSKELEKI